MMDRDVPKRKIVYAGTHTEARLLDYSPNRASDDLHQFPTHNAVLALAKCPG